MADVDASLLLFCREIKKEATVAISGEAADEIFGGYPWFHREDALNADTFPWSLAAGMRGRLLLAGRRRLDSAARIHRRPVRAKPLAEVPQLAGRGRGERAGCGEMSYLNITRFMPTLLDRKDRMSMAVGLEVRVPFCDHRLVEYVFNIPWEIKTAGDREKGHIAQSAGRRAAGRRPVPQKKPLPENA